MNNEPIQFLPVAEFNRPKPAISIQIFGGVSFALGMVVGALIVFGLVVTFAR